MKKTFDRSRVAAASIVVMTLLSALPSFAQESKCSSAIAHAEKNLASPLFRNQSLAAWMARGLTDKFIQGDDKFKDTLTDEDRKNIARFASLSIEDAQKFKAALMKKLRAYRKRVQWTACPDSSVVPLADEVDVPWYDAKPKALETYPKGHVCKSKTSEHGTQPLGGAEINWDYDEGSDGTIGLRTCYAMKGTDFYCVERTLLSSSKDPSKSADLTPTSNDNIFMYTLNPKTGGWGKSWPKASAIADLAIGEPDELYQKRILEAQGCTPDGQIADRKISGKSDAPIVDANECTFVCGADATGANQ